jgi:hypothetical protein
MNQREYRFSWKHPSLFIYEPADSSSGCAVGCRLWVCVVVTTLTFTGAGQLTTPLIGFQFGIAIAAVLVFHEGVRPAYKLIPFVTASTVAFPISVLATWPTLFLVGYLGLGTSGKAASLDLRRWQRRSIHYLSGRSNVEPMFSHHLRLHEQYVRPREE